MLLYISDVLTELERLPNFLVFNRIHVTGRLLQTIGDVPRGRGNSVLGAHHSAFAHVVAI